MAYLILQIAVSLNGYIEDANGSIDFMDGDTSLDAVHTATLALDRRHDFRAQGPHPAGRLLAQGRSGGRGRRRALRLIESQTFCSGVSLLRYRIG
jgi:hypothetical protein